MAIALLAVSEVPHIIVHRPKIAVARENAVKMLSANLRNGVRKVATASLHCRSFSTFLTSKLAPLLSSLVDSTPNSDHRMQG